MITLKLRRPGYVGRQLMKPPTMYLIPAPNLLNSAALYRLPILFETKLLLPLLGSLFIVHSMLFIVIYCTKSSIRPLNEINF